MTDQTDMPTGVWKLKHGGALVRVTSPEMYGDAIRGGDNMHRLRDVFITVEVIEPGGYAFEPDDPDLARVREEMHAVMPSRSYVMIVDVTAPLEKGMRYRWLACFEPLLRMSADIEALERRYMAARREVRAAWGLRDGN